MKRVINICIASAMMLTSVHAIEVERGKVYTSGGNFSHLGHMIGGRVLADGSEEAVDLRPQSVEKYYDAAISQGQDLHTSLHASLQYSLSAGVEMQIIDIGAKDTLIAVMNNSTGKLVALTRSEYTDNLTIKTQEIPIYKDRFADMLFEPRELILPFITTLISSKYQYDTETIKDMGFKKAFFSIAPKYFYNGLRGFGFGKPSGIDLPYDVAGDISTLDVDGMLKDTATPFTNKGMQVTFMQMIKAYGVFFAKGTLHTPHLGVKLVDANHTKALTFPSSGYLPKDIATKVKRVLKQKAKKNIDVIRMDSVEVGGILGKGIVYAEGNDTKEDYSAYFGFAEDMSGRSYTIGVFSIYDNMEKPDMHNKYLHRKSPMPIFNYVVEELAKEKLLWAKPETLGKKAMSPMPKGEIVEHYDEHITNCPEGKEDKWTLACKYMTYQAPEDAQYAHAILDGKVSFLGIYKEDNTKVMILKHKNNISSVYANLAYIPKDIQEGQVLKKGYILGIVDETLKFQILKDKLPVDPLEYMEL